MSNKLPGCRLANARRSRSKHILQWWYHNEVSVHLFINTNLVQMRSILSLKKSRNVLARDDVSGGSGSEFEGFSMKNCVEGFPECAGIVR